MHKEVRLYDTTLRDGAQTEGISFSVLDKIMIAKKLDQLGIHFIEGGWPGSNPKDVDFFKRARRMGLKNSRIVAFGSTRKAHTSVRRDTNIAYLLKAGTRIVTIFGKSWDLHVRCALKTSLDENLRMICDSVRYLKSKGLSVLYDAEHFFDGYRANPAYAMKTVKAAVDAGADNVTLCDTNGGALPAEVGDIVGEVAARMKVPLGIHAHNDADMAVANSIVAVRAGCQLVQGTINGYGERCGNANLCSIIPNLKLKLGINCVSDRQLSSLTEISRYVSEIANMVPRNEQPFIGVSAFAHKGGVHVSAVLRRPQTYEHIQPELVGNRRRILISELAGKGAVVYKAGELEIDFTKDRKAPQKILALLKELEHKGYQFEGAEGSFELLMRKQLGRHKRFFELEGFRVIVEKDKKGDVRSEATIKLKVKGAQEHTASEGDGPVNALDNALRKALERFYPGLRKMSLADFKVRVINARAGTAARVRVLIESRDEKDEWGTVGVSENIIEASWQALVDSIEYKLMKDKAKR
jgi:2-isopropylmalate synthase